MVDELRLLAVHVEESHPGRFEWVITERRSRDQWEEIDRATHWRGSYKEAMADGLVSLEGLIDDLDRGPRRTLDRRSAPEEDSKVKGPPTQSDDEQDVLTPPAKPKKAPYFGFGPIR